MEHPPQRREDRAPPPRLRRKARAAGRAAPGPRPARGPGGKGPGSGGRPAGTPPSKGFDYSLDFGAVDFRARPDLYRIGKGEQGVLLVQPYKGELLPLWRFRTPEIARASAEALYARFLAYREAGDFVGMDMARKFLQMGVTRARRYANHPSGRKYAPGTREVLPRGEDPVKAESAAIFRAWYLKAKEDPAYLAAARRHREAYGG